MFWVFGMIQNDIEPRSPGPLTNTQTGKLMVLWKLTNIWLYICIHIYIHLGSPGKAVIAVGNGLVIRDQNLKVAVLVWFCAYVLGKGMKLCVPSTQVTRKQ